MRCDDVTGHVSVCLGDKQPRNLKPKSTRAGRFRNHPRVVLQPAEVGDLTKEPTTAGPGKDSDDLLFNILACSPGERHLDRRGVDMHVYEPVTTAQGALRLLSASQAYSSVVRAEPIDGREWKRQVG